MSGLQNFRSYNLAVQFHHACRSENIPSYLRDQLLRASSSVALNLAEGSAKATHKDRLRFYRISLGSLRECQAALALGSIQNRQLFLLADQLGAHLYKLCKSAPA